MIGSSVSVRSVRAITKTPRRAAWAAAAVLLLGAPAARAQLFFNLFEPSPQRLERNLDADGYQLRGPLVRRGDVYVGDVVAESGARERLVIDARTGRILEQFPVRADRWRDRDAEETWNAPARPPQAMAPRPRDDDWNWDGDLGRPRPRDDLAGVDPSVKPADPSAKPNVIHGVDGTNGPSIIEVEKPKIRPHKKKPASASLGKVPASVPPAAALATPPSVNPAEAAPPAPNAPLGAESGKPETSPAPARVETREPATEAKPATESKATAEKPVGESKPAAGAKPAVEAKAVGESRPTAETKPAAEPKAVGESKPAAGAKPAVEAKAVGESRPTAETKPAAEPKAVGESKPAAETKPIAEAKPMADAKPAPEARAEKRSKAVNDVPINPLD